MTGVQTCALPISDVTIFHNPSCGTSRNTLALIRHAGIEPVVIEYLRSPPTLERLRKFVLRAKVTIEDISGLKRTHLDYFREFYADTAMFGGQYGIACGLQFFGADKIVFATDTPLGPIKPTIEVIDRLDLSETDRRKVYVGNAEKLLKKKL